MSNAKQHNVTNLRRPFQTKPENEAARERIAEVVLSKWEEAKRSESEVVIGWLELEQITGINMSAPKRLKPGELDGRSLFRDVCRRNGVVYEATPSGGVVLLGASNAMGIVQAAERKAARSLKRAGDVATTAIDRVGDRLPTNERDRIARTSALMQTLELQATVNAKQLKR